LTTQLHAYLEHYFAKWFCCCVVGWSLFWYKSRSHSSWWNHPQGQRCRSEAGHNISDHHGQLLHSLKLAVLRHAVMGHRLISC